MIQFSFLTSFITAIRNCFLVLASPISCGTMKREIRADLKRKHRLTWRGYFWFLAPLGIICAILAAWLLPKTKPTEGFRVNVAKIDFLGCLTSSIAIIFLLLPVSGGGTYYAWNSPMVISMLVIGICSLVAFILVEWKWARLPIIPCILSSFPPSQGPSSSCVCSVNLSHKRRMCASFSGFWSGLVLHDLHNVSTVVLSESSGLVCPCISRFPDTYNRGTNFRICSRWPVCIEKEALRGRHPPRFHGVPYRIWLDDPVRRYYSSRSMRGDSTSCGYRCWQLHSGDHSCNSGPYSEKSASCRPFVSELLQISWSRIWRGGISSHSTKRSQTRATSPVHELGQFIILSSPTY